MSTQRYISTSFWDDEWVHKLDPSEKLLYLYYMTNPLTNIAGIYKLSESRICYDTGFNENTIRHIMEKFELAKKAFRYKEWIILPNWAKHQKVTERNNIKTGIDNLLLSLPQDVYTYAVQKGYKYIYLKELGRNIESPLKPLEAPSQSSNYSDLDSDIDIDIDSDINRDAPEIPTHAITSKPLQCNDGTKRIGYAQSAWNYAELKPPSKILPLQFKGDDLSGCLATMQAYPDTEIEEAINNYANILKSNDHEIGFKYGSFQGFMIKGVEKFVNDAEPFTRYRKEVAQIPESNDNSKYDQLMQRTE